MILTPRRRQWISRHRLAIIVWYCALMVTVSVALQVLQSTGRLP